MDAATGEALAALRDIHLPADVSAWPLAPGWWLLAGTLLLGALAAALAVRARRRRERPWQDAAAEELTRIETDFGVQQDVVALAVSLSVLLRRSVLARFPGEKIAALRGDDWLGFLCRDRTAPPDTAAVDPDSLRLVRELTRTAYSGVPATEGPPDAWIAFVRTWIGAPA
jgi:hypothetical protein